MATIENAIEEFIAMVRGFPFISDSETLRRLDFPGRMAATRTRNLSYFVVWRARLVQDDNDTISTNRVDQ